jgi:hypothetical protein
LAARSDGVEPADAKLFGGVRPAVR